MDTHMKTRNSLLALLGVAALTIYILACSSFSPDDKRIAYPAFDVNSGLIGISVYDRDARKTEIAFVPGLSEPADSNASPAMARSQWLPDGKNILVAYGGGKMSDTELNLAVVPWPARGVVRVFHLTGLSDAGPMLLWPLAVAGDNLFLSSTESNIVIRLNLKTGQRLAHQLEVAARNVALYPGPDGRSIFYLQEAGTPDRSVTFGSLDPGSFARKPIITFTNQVPEHGFFAWDPPRKRVAFTSDVKNTLGIIVVEDGKQVFSRSIGSPGLELQFSRHAFFLKGDVILAAFEQKKPNEKTASYGLMEIPLNNAPVRMTTLIPVAESGDELVWYLEPAVSHDGKLAAVSSAYIAGGLVKPEDCALFLVDLSSPQRTVTKIPIPIPLDLPK